MSHIIQEIASSFQELNITVTEDVLQKCSELCRKYNIKPEDFCDQWYAFTVSNLNGAAPTIEHLDKLERKVLEKDTKQNIISTPKAKDHTVSYEPDAQSLVDSYTVATPKSNRIHPVRDAAYSTPKNVQTPKRPPIIDTAVDSDTASPSISMSEQYSQRTDSRKVQVSYGEPTATYKRTADLDISIKNASEQSMHPNIKYMYEVLSRKATSLSGMIDYLGKEILRYKGLTLSEGILKCLMGDVITYGRILSDTEGKMNAQSILLEGTAETNLCHATKLNVSNVKKYSLFPGQVVAVTGNNITANDLIAEDIFCSAPLEFPENIPVLDGPLEIVVAAGPFTLPENISYEPLNDLLRYIEEYQPHVLILLGPFLESTHSSVSNGDVLQTFDSFFEGLVEKIANTVQVLGTKVVIVSSQKDVHHHPVYPTPPYTVQDSNPNIHFVSDPCMLDVNGLIIGITTADVLLHLGNYEVYCDKVSNIPPDRMGRLASHLLHQRNFYPLYPPIKGMSVDHELYEQFGVMDCKPHILVLPSNLRHFVKSIDDCLVINPERLTKGHVAGTYARIEVTSGSGQSICNRTSCQILRI